MKIPLIGSWYNYMHVLVSYRTRISVLGYVTYLVCSLHVLEYVIICTRIISYRIVLIFPYSGTSPTSFVLCTYSSTSLSVLVSYRIVSYSFFRTRVHHLPRSFSAHTRVRHYPYSTWVQDKKVQHSLPLVYLLRFPFFFDDNFLT